jgi:hypothetical protein
MTLVYVRRTHSGRSTDPAAQWWYLDLAMRSTPRPEDLRRWVENQRAAQVRERESAREMGFSPDPVQAALDLIELAATLHGWPIREDAVKRREDEAARQQWDRLRKALGGP